MRTKLSNLLYALAKAIRPGFKKHDRVVVTTPERTWDSIVAANYPHNGWHDTVAVVKPSGDVIYVQESQLKKS